MSSKYPTIWWTTQHMIIKCPLYFTISHSPSRPDGHHPVHIGTKIIFSECVPSFYKVGLSSALSDFLFPCTSPSSRNFNLNKLDVISIGTHIHIPMINTNYRWKDCLSSRHCHMCIITANYIIDHLVPLESWLHMHTSSGWRTQIPGVWRIYSLESVTRDYCDCVWL